jgi:uncharacterized protein (TIGR00730 family)
VRLVTHNATRAELKLVNAALKEFAYAFRVFAPYRGMSKVSIFGSARVKPGEPEYIAARDFAAQIANHGWMVITGAGPGIMAAGHEGAGAEHSFGANIRLPGLNPANAYIAKDGKLINFKYFFTRKVTFLKESDAFVLMPGGWGTLDETFELLTLAQTARATPPVVFLEPQASTYRKTWTTYPRAGDGARFISEDDVSLYKVASTVPRQSAKSSASTRTTARPTVGDRLVLRLNRAPDEQRLPHQRRLPASSTTAPFEVIAPTPPELKEGDDPKRTASRSTPCTPTAASASSSTR